MSFLALSAPVALPLLLALCLTAPQARALIWRMMPFAPLPALALALLADPPTGAQADWLVLGLHLGLDEVSRLFVIFTALLWCAAGASARHWLRADARATSFGVMFLMAQAGNMGLLLAQDVAGFYACFALMSFASYGLVLHSRDTGRPKGRHGCISALWCWESWRFLPGWCWRPCRRNRCC
jgi:formate hydrogenlyase subunit 3/multisubunit Na+/H+ antiporter MnhD subunit